MTTTLSDKAVQDINDEEAKAAAEAAYRAAYESTQCLLDFVQLQWDGFVQSKTPLMRNFSPPPHITHVLVRGSVYEVAEGCKLWFEPNGRRYYDPTRLTMLGLYDAQGNVFQARFGRPVDATPDTLRLIRLTELRSRAYEGARPGTNPNKGMA